MKMGEENFNQTYRKNSTLFISKVLVYEKILIKS